MLPKQGCVDTLASLAKIYDTTWAAFCGISEQESSNKREQKNRDDFFKF